MVTRTFGAGTNIGKVRRINEDSFFADEDLGLWLIADGMGGHADGDVASATATQVIEEAVRRGDSLGAAIQQAHTSIQKSIDVGDGKSGMGTTVVAIAGVSETRSGVRAEKAETGGGVRAERTGSDPTRFYHYQLAWVGDSRAYLWHDAEANQNDMQLSRISKDHSLVQVLVDIGEITQQQAFSHPKKNIITQYVGQVDKEQLQIDNTEVALEPGQKILLCSDGLSDEVGDDEMEEIVRQSVNNGLDNQAIVDALIAAALRHGGSDNVTVIIVS